MALLLVLLHSVTSILPSVRVVTESNVASIQPNVRPAAAATRLVSPEVEAGFRERAYGVHIRSGASRW